MDGVSEAAAGLPEDLRGDLIAGRERVLGDLREFLRIPSISADPAHGPDMARAAGWVAGRLRSAGPIDVRIVETAGHPVVLGRWRGAPDAPTILVYGHYDVQSPDPLDAWTSPPFAPEVRDGRLYARGASDDKGPMLIPIEVARSFFATRGRPPVNLTFLFEGEEEIGSPSLEAFVTEHARELEADYALSADGAMWRIDEPSVITGSRGLVALEVEMRGSAKDLHSGRHGGAVRNPLHAIAEMIASLHDGDGRVAVEGFYDRVRPLSEADRRAIAALRFDEEAYRAEIGAPALFGEPGYTALERLWARPTLEVNGLGGGYQGEGGKTVIPAVAKAKISCRLVPDQRPDEIASLVARHLEERCPADVEALVRVRPGGAGAYRLAADHPGLLAARGALRRLYRQEPLSVLIGGTLPVSEILSRVLGIDTVYFSFSTADEDFHAPDEFFRVSRLWDGLEAWADLWLTAAGGDR
jgi:acetylornithine deacetylase/succinyl-diaminopimelate desuccinylase-like protein